MIVNITLRFIILISPYVVQKTFDLASDKSTANNNILKLMLLLPVKFPVDLGVHLWEVHLYSNLHLGTSKSVHGSYIRGVHVSEGQLTL